jgi:hypothetical protein
VSEEGNFEQILLSTIDESLMSLGEGCRAILYKYLASALSLRKDQIPTRLEGFTGAVREIFRLGARVIESLILKTLCEQLDIDYSILKDMEFQTAIEEIRMRTTIPSGVGSGK